MKMICVISLHRLTHQVGEWVGLALRYMFSSVSEHSFAAINFELRCDPLRHPRLEREKRKQQIELGSRRRLRTALVESVIAVDVLDSSLGPK